MDPQSGTSPGSPLPEPGLVPNFSVLAPLGSWGLGETYRARDTRVGRTVALRLAPHAAFTTPADRDDFLRDARAAAELSHPNIATLFDVGEYPDGVYLAYEFASGALLRQEMDGRSVNTRRALELAMQMADALTEAHARGLVHGDLRPDTVIVTRKGSAKILETGMSRWTRGGRLRFDAVSPSRSAAADPSVTAYLAPEQVLDRAADARTDVFALGVILYEMIAGRHPFGTAPSAGTHGHPAGGAPAPSLPASTAPGLAAVVNRALAIDKGARHQSMASLAADLRRSAAALDAASGRPDLRREPLLDAEPAGRGWWVGAAAAIGAALAWWMLR